MIRSHQPETHRRQGKKIRWRAGTACLSLSLAASMDVFGTETAIGDVRSGLEGWGRRIDYAHQQITEGILEAVNRFDRLFGDERVAQETDRSRFAVQLGIRADERDGAQLEQRVRLHVEIPNARQRLLFFFEDDAQTEEPSRWSAITNAIQESRPLTGLRLAIRQMGRFRFVTDAGLRWGSAIQAFGRARLSLCREWDLWAQRLTQSVIWYTRDGWRAVAEAQWTRKVSDKRQWRFTSQLDWREGVSGVEPSQTIEWLIVPSPVRGHRWTLRGAWPETPACREATYVLEYTFRRRVYRDWLFFGIGPRVDFSQAHDYVPNLGGQVFFECLFDRNRLR